MQRLEAKAQSRGKQPREYPALVPLLPSRARDQPLCFAPWGGRTWVRRWLWVASYSHGKLVSNEKIRRQFRLTLVRCGGAIFLKTLQVEGTTHRSQWPSLSMVMIFMRAFEMADGTDRIFAYLTLHPLDSY